MFFFNLSAVKTTEEVLRAEVHLYKRKPQPWMPSGSKLQILLHEIGPNYISKTGRVTLHRASHGWQWRDVTDAVLSCLATSRKSPHLFAINFQAQKIGSKMRTVALKKFSIHHSRPFLIIYSNETETVKLDQLDKLAERLKLFLPGQHHPGQGTDQATVNQTSISTASGSDDFIPPLDSNNNGTRFVHHISRGRGPKLKIILDEIDAFNPFNVVGKDKKVLENKTETSTARNEIKKKRKDHRRHKYDREVVLSQPSSATSTVSETVNVTTTSEEDNLTQSEKPPTVVAASVALSDDIHPANMTHLDRAKRSILTNEIPQDPVDFNTVTKYNVLNTNPGVLLTRQRPKQKKDTRLIPYPKKSQHKKKRRKRKRPRRKNSRRRRLRFPKDWKNEDENASIKDTEDHLCKKRKLHVNFDDIGWGEWIISPRWFNAHYCAGSCPFPLTKKLRPSNHATIQSIVHAIGIYPGVPAPCCVPDSVSSITLLYFDEDRNVVLKNYPGMTVLTCACR